MQVLTRAPSDAAMALSRYASGILSSAETTALDMRERPEGGDLSWLAAYLMRQENHEAEERSETTASNPDEALSRASEGSALDSPLDSPICDNNDRTSAQTDRTSWVTSGDDEEGSIPAGAHDNKRRRKVGWTRAEDLAILATVRRLGTQWPRIAMQLPGRTPDAVRNRWHRLQKTHSLADTEEGRVALDALLLSCGIGKDSTPPERVGAADTPIIGEQCIKGADHGRAMWTAEEDALIEEGVRRFGCKWRKVASALPGRSDSSVRNRWMRLQKERAASVPATLPTPDAFSTATTPAVTPTITPTATPATTPAATPTATPAATPAAMPTAAAAGWVPAVVITRPPPFGALKRRMSDAFTTTAGGASSGPLTSPLLGFGIELLVDAVQGALAEDATLNEELRKSLGDDSGWDYGDTMPSPREKSEPPALFDHISVCEMSSLSLRASRSTSDRTSTPRTAPTPQATEEDATSAFPSILEGLSILLTAMAGLTVVAAVRARSK